MTSDYMLSGHAVGFIYGAAMEARRNKLIVTGLVMVIKALSLIELRVQSVCLWGCDEYILQKSECPQLWRQ